MTLAGRGKAARKTGGEFSARDENFMRRALAEARRALGSTRPNPIVGAVVARGGRLIAVGHHARAGTAHAEVSALARAGARARGATLYVTLEPCAHTGRTGPCTEAIIAAGILRVVVACRDENPLVLGRGIAKLRRAGVTVQIGCLAEECGHWLRPFFTFITQRRPLITLKVAATLDGVIGDLDAVAARRGPRAPRFITSAAAREAAHRLRAQHDAILVGVGTVLADDPRLTTRLPGRRVTGSGLLRVVLDSQLRTPIRARLLRKSDGGTPPLLIAARPVGRDMGFERRHRALLRAGAEVVLLARGVGGRPAIPSVLHTLYQHGIHSLLVEGGAEVHGAFVRARLVDRVALFLAPRLAGGGVPIVRGPGRGLARALPLGPLAVEKLGPDLLVTADVVARS